MIRHKGSGFGNNIAVSIFTQAVSFACTFLLVPFYLRAWGAQDYGHWVAMTSVIAYLSLFDLGGQIYIQNVLSTQYARGEEASFRRTLSDGVAFYLALGLGAWGIWSCLLAYARYAFVGFIGHTLTGAEISVLACLGANQFLLSIPFGVYATSYRARGLFARASLLGVLTKIIIFSSSVGVLLLHGKLATLALIQLLCGIVSVLILLVDSRRAMPTAFPLRISPAAARRGVSFLQGSILTWLIAIGALLNQQGLVLVLARAETREIVALFATHQTIANISAYVGALVSGPILPEMNHLWSLDKKTELQNLWVRAVAGVTITTGAVGVFLFIVAPYFFIHWTSHRLALQPNLLALMLVQSVVGGGAGAAGWALLATNHHRGYALASLANGSVTILLAILLITRIGPTGLVAMSLAVDVVFALLLVPLMAARTLRLSVRRIFMTIGGTFGSLLLLFVIVWLAVRLLPENLRLLALLPLAAGAGSLGYWLLRRSGWRRAALPNVG